jgi:hypothetical protein
VAASPCRQRSDEFRAAEPERHALQAEASRHLPWISSLDLCFVVRLMRAIVWTDGDI